MTVKQWVYQGDKGIGLFQTFSLSEINNNPVTLQIDDAQKHNVLFFMKNIDDERIELGLEFEAKQFDVSAVEWCKSRGLKGNS